MSLVPRSSGRLLSRLAQATASGRQSSAQTSGWGGLAPWRHYAVGGDEAPSRAVSLERQNEELQKQLAAMQAQMAAMQAATRAGPQPGAAGATPPPPASPASRGADGPPNPAPPPPAATSTASPDAKIDAKTTAPEPGSGPSAASSSSSSSADSTDPDAGYVHGHFSRTNQMQKLQPLLEAAERSHAYDGLTSGGTGSGAWSYLHDNPPARLVGSLMQPLRAVARNVVLPGVLARLQTMAERMIKEEVEHNFDSEEFLEGVREAVPFFYTAMATSDTEALRHMASSKAVEAVDRDRQRLLDAGLAVRSVATTISHAAIGGVNLWGPASMRAFAPEWVDEAADDRAATAAAGKKKKAPLPATPAAPAAPAAASGEAAGKDDAEAATATATDSPSSASSSTTASTPKKKEKSTGSSSVNLTKSWLVMVVNLDVRLDVVYGLVGVSATGSDSGSDSGSGPSSTDMEASGVVRRNGTWLLARGPLPKGAVNDLDSRWRVLAWW